MQTVDRPQPILLPAKPLFVGITLSVALLLNLLPLGRTAGVPDFVALALAFWCSYQPRLVGISLAWMLGLVMDIAHGALFGQHALAYACLAYLCIALARRMQRFTIWAQALHVLPILLAAQLVNLAVRLAAGDSFPGWTYFLSSATGALAWPLTVWLLLAPQRRSPDPDEPPSV